MRIRIVILALLVIATNLAAGQTGPTEITDSDVINMTKAGIGEQTIILAIQRGPVKFDTSPQSLITLKASGVSDQVLNAILASVTSKSQVGSEAQTVAAQALFQKALDAIGPHDKVALIHSYRWTGQVLQNSQGNARTLERETIRILPDKSYTSFKAAAGPLQKQVITPEFNYRNAGTAIVAVPLSDLETAHIGFEFEIISIAQHPDTFTVKFAEGGKGENGDYSKLQISKSEKSVVWKIDTQTGRLLSATQTSASGDVLTDYSDWRSVDGVNFPFKRHMTEAARTSDFTISDYALNPTIDESIFQPPTQSPAQGLTLKVLQEQSVPYVQQSGGGVSTSCNIVGNANTSGYANTIGNTTFGNATTTSNQHMSCNSYDTTIRWPHVLNVMFAEASDGNSYMFACDRAWRWSKCIPLSAGQVFNARFTDKGLEVEAFSTKGKEENPTYHVLQSRSSR